MICGNILRMGFLWYMMTYVVRRWGRRSKGDIWWWKEEVTS